MTVPNGSLMELRPFVNSERGLNALWRAGITNIGDLWLTSDADLLTIRGLGKKSLADLKNAVDMWIVHHQVAS